MKKWFVAGIIAVFVVGGGWWFLMKNGSGIASAVLPTPLPSDQQKQYHLADLSEHNTQSDCWMAIDGGVYNVTSYVSLHPGGSRILQGCGTDATTLFHNRPDREPDHSSAAVAILSHFKIGTLVI